MRRLQTHLAASCLTTFSVGFVLMDGASAVVYFNDDFEAQNLSAPLEPPPIGNNYAYPNGQTNGVAIATTPAIGTQSLELVRSGAQNGDLIARSINGVIADDKTVELRWSHFLKNSAA